MSLLDALSLATSLRRRLVDLSLDEAYVQDPKLREICANLWAGRGDEGGLVADLVVEGAFPPATSTDTLDGLVAKQLFTPELRDQLRAVWPGNRTLRTHQEAAINLARDREKGVPAIGVSAGTGAGKTESFLFPMLDDLVHRPRGTRRGMRCLILYPTNALVNDKVARLYSRTTRATTSDAGRRSIVSLTSSPMRSNAWRPIFSTSGGSTSMTTRGRCSGSGLRPVGGRRVCAFTSCSAFANARAASSSARCRSPKTIESTSSESCAPSGRCSDFEERRPSSSFRHLSIVSR